MELEDEADVLAAGGGARLVAAVRHELAVDPDVAVVRLVEEPQEVEQGALAAARGPDDRVDLAPAGLEGDPAQHVHPAVPLPQVAVQALAADGDVGVAGLAGGGRGLAHCAVPRMTSPGCRRAARRAGTRLATMTTTTATTTAQK